MIRRPPESTLFPSTTLSRSSGEPARILVVDDHEDNVELLRARLEARGYRVEAAMDGQRSEEHTSELQSRQYLVCRLLLEKKKKKDNALPCASTAQLTRL